MSGKLYIKNQLPVLFVHLLGMIALSLFLIAIGNNIQSVLFILVVWTLTVTCYLSAAFIFQKKNMDKMLDMIKNLEEKYLIAEIIPIPEQADQQVFYKLLTIAEKSMLEQIGKVNRERTEYREYIEQWIHEVKTPITAIKLLCENNRSSLTRDLLAELEKINRFTEQALYFARSEHTEKDYSIREIQLNNVIHEAIADNKYILRQNYVAITVDSKENSVYTDDKWVRFILNQIINNAIKYRTKHPKLHFSTEKRENRLLLSIWDNGIGITEPDLPRIFEKGFTGQNGRIVQSSTGIGLYLCKRLCDKLGIGLAAYSDENGTTFVLSFSVNHFITDVQN